MLLLLASLALAPISAQQQQTELDEARRWWGNVAARSAPSNYTFEYVVTRDGVREDSRFIDVREDVVTAVTLEVMTWPQDPQDPADFPNGVVGLFDMIQDAIDDNTTMTTTIITVDYDQQYRYPLEISIQQDTTTILNIQVPSMMLYTILQRDLNYSMERFRTLALTDFDYVIQVWCFCEKNYVRPKRIEVRNNAIISAVDIENGEISDTTIYPTVRDAFDRIQNSITDFHASIIVEYDWTYGYPKSMAFDMGRNLADDTISFEFLDFIPRRFTPEQAALDSAMALWEFQALDRYSFGYQKSCFCEAAYRAALLVQVENAEVVRIRTREGEAVLPQVAMNVPSLEVYDVDAGYPTSVYVDYDERIADEELSIVVDYLAPVGQWQSDLVQGKSTWEATGLVTYTYVYQRTSTNTTQEEATTTTTMTVEVVDNVVVNVIPLILGEPAEGIERQGIISDADIIIPTIDGLFLQVQAAINSDAFRIVVEYDEPLGYPSSIFIDYDEFVVEEELSISATLSASDAADAAQNLPTGEQPTPAPNTSTSTSTEAPSTTGVVGEDETDAPTQSPAGSEESGGLCLLDGGRLWGWLSPMLFFFCSWGIVW
jgi:hypothetical protein